MIVVDLGNGRIAIFQLYCAAQTDKNGEKCISGIGKGYSLVTEITWAVLPPGHRRRTDHRAGHRDQWHRWLLGGAQVHHSSGD